MAYSAISDVYTVFGELNVKDWADLDRDSNATSIANRITSAIEEADAIIDDTLRGGHYVVPFTTTPATVKWLSAKLAGVALHDSRGHIESDAGRMLDPLAFHRKHAKEMLAKIKAGIIRLDATTRSKAPAVVTDEDE